MKFSLLKSIVSGKWHISSQTYLEYQGVVEMILKHNFQFDVEKPGRYRSYLIENPQNRNQAIAVHSLDGVMLLEDPECAFTRGTERTVFDMQNYDQKTEVVAHIMRIHSGGGQSISLDPFESAFNRNKFSKPVYVSVRHMAASAAYGIASFGKEIYAEQESAVLGSIGTMISFAASPKEMTDQDGFRYVRMYASKSSAKNEAFERAIEGDYKLLIEKELDPTNERFASMIKRNRPQVTEEYFDGRDTEASNAVGTLIDGILSFDQLVQKIFQDLKQQNSNVAMNQNNTDFIAQTLGLGSIETDNEGFISLTQEQINRLGEALQKNAQSGQQENAHDPVVVVNNKPSDSVQDQMRKMQIQLEANSRKMQELEQKNSELAEENRELIDMPVQTTKPVEQVQDAKAIMYSNPIQFNGDVESTLSEVAAKWKDIGYKRSSFKGLVDPKTIR